MSSIGTGYDLSAAQFSPDGRIFQVEYALKAVENSSTAIGIQCKDGVILAVERLISSKLHENDANQRIMNIDTHIGIAVAGLLTDAHEVVDIARQEASNYRQQYGSPIPLRYLVERVSAYMHAYTLYAAVRPFGASVLLVSYDVVEGKPEMFMIDPSGISLGYNGCAIGKARQTAKTEIEKLKVANMTCKDALKEAAKVIYVVHDEVKDKSFELQMSWVGSESEGIHQRVPDNLIMSAEATARASMEESDSDED